MSLVSAYRWKGTLFLSFQFLKINFHFRPTMIRYGISNIRELFGHKINLSMVYKNPICQLEQKKQEE